MRNKIKLFVKNNAFKLRQKSALNKLDKLMKKSDYKITKKEDGKKILFNLIYGMYGKIIFWECALAKSLQMRGYDVKALVCGNAFKMCTTEYTVQKVHDEKTCKNCCEFSEQFLKTIKLPYSTYNDYISKKESENIEKKVMDLSIGECEKYLYKNIDVGRLSLNAVIRYFKGSLNPDPKEYSDILRRELINAIIAIDVAEKIYKKEKPDVIVTRHLGYSSWGGFAKYFVKKGVRVCSPGEGYNPKTLFFVIDNANKEFSRYFKEIRNNKMLNKEEIKELEELLEKRFKGAYGDTIDYEFTEHRLDEEDFNFKKYEKTFAIYPNVPWDSSLLNANKAFKDVYEWVSYTIDLFKQKPNYQLIIKIHPSETKVMKSENTVMDYLKKKYPTLPKNIKIIPPDTKISPYSLFPYIEKGIVYNGTIGLEMALKKIPVVLAGFTHYGEKGFTFDAETKQEYKKLLFQDLKLTEKQYELCKVYAYFYFIKTFIPYDYVFSNKKTLNFMWNIENIEKFSKRKDKYLDHICDYISEETVYQDW